MVRHKIGDAGQVSYSRNVCLANGQQKVEWNVA